MKANLRFKLPLNYENNQSNNKKTPKVSNNLYQGRCGIKCTGTIDCRLASASLKSLYVNFCQINLVDSKQTCKTSRQFK